MQSGTSVYEHIVTKEMYEKIGRISFRKEKSYKDYECYSYKKETFFHVCHLFIARMVSSTLSSLWISSQAVFLAKNQPSTLRLTISTDTRISQRKSPWLKTRNSNSKTTSTSTLPTRSKPRQQATNSKEFCIYTFYKRSFPDHAEKGGLSSINV